MVETDFHKTEAFHNGCLRRICQIFWPRTISNLKFHAKTKSKGVVSGGWDILRMSHNKKRMQDRPKATWRRTGEKEIKTIGLT